jgi:hypothetical protein
MVPGDQQQVTKYLDRFRGTRPTRAAWGSIRFIPHGSWPSADSDDEKPVYFLFSGTRVAAEFFPQKFETSVTDPERDWSLLLDLKTAPADPDFDQSTDTLRIVYGGKPEISGGMSSLADFGGSSVVVEVAPGIDNIQFEVDYMEISAPLRGTLHITGFRRCEWPHRFIADIQKGVKWDKSVPYFVKHLH